jgi:hypothetical protein
MAPSAASDYGILTQALRDKAVKVSVDSLDYYGTARAVASFGILLDVEKSREGQWPFTTYAPAKRMLITWNTISSVEVQS